MEISIFFNYINYIEILIHKSSKNIHKSSKNIKFINLH